LNEQGNIRLFPINNTSLYIPATGEHPTDASFIAPVDDLLSLKELPDYLSGSR